MFVESGAPLVGRDPHRNPPRTPASAPRRVVPFRPRPLPPPGCPSWYLACKRTIDVAAALVLLVLTGPVILLAALAVKLTSRGPAIYSQRRLGRDGRPFTIYKLRTMVHDCESLSGPRWSIPGDPRVTPVGAVLRRTHLDELPQLINVLRGDMSLVGPRPERPEFLPELEDAFPCYRDRLAVRPGISGLAQIQLPPDIDLAGVRPKLACDLYYIDQLSLGLDLRLLLCTGLYALGIPHRFSAALLRIPTLEEVERDLEALSPGRLAVRLRKSA